MEEHALSPKTTLELASRLHDTFECPNEPHHRSELLEEAPIRRAQAFDRA
jgi:hypothetical protein